LLPAGEVERLGVDEEAVEVKENSFNGH
jgi:hypothetical protein